MRRSIDRQRRSAAAVAAVCCWFTLFPHHPTLSLSTTTSTTTTSSTLSSSSTLQYIISQRQKQQTLNKRDSSSTSNTSTTNTNTNTNSNTNTKNTARDALVVDATDLFDDCSSFDFLYYTRTPSNTDDTSPQLSPHIPLPQSHAAAQISEEEEEEELVTKIQRLGLPLLKDSSTKTSDNINTILSQGHYLQSLNSKNKLTTKQWAASANLSPAQLRRAIASYRTARQQLVASNTGLVHSIVRQNHYYRRSRVQYEDLVQEGMLGLIRAAELYNPDKGVKFSTYATIWIKGVLSNNKIFDEHVSIPTRIKTKYNLISKVLKEHEDSGGIDDQELAKKCQISVEEIQDIMSRVGKLKNMVSLDMTFRMKSDSKEMQVIDKVIDSESLETLENINFKTDVITALTRTLEEREVFLIKLRYGLENGNCLSLRECADHMGISQQRASQLASKCLKKLREAEHIQGLQEYLVGL